MLSVAICDDTPSCLDEIEKQVKLYFSSRCYHDYGIVKFTSPSKLLSCIDEGMVFDAVILDVLMPESLGTDTARKIQLRSPGAKIIFVSVSRDYAVDAYDIGAVHYVTKPVSSESLALAMDRAVMQSQEAAHKRLIIHMKDGVIQSVDCDDIIYIESMGYRRVVHTKEGEYEEMRKSLSALCEELNLLCPGRFLTPYRGYIINLDEIDMIMPGHIMMRNGAKILIKRGDYRRLRDLYFSWTFSSSSP